MNRNNFIAKLAPLLIILLVAPTTFFIAPPRAHAVVAILPAQLAQLAEETIDVVKNTITAVNSVTSAAAEYALYIDKYILEPLAFIESGKLIQAITGGVINFINGSSNGTGQSQFVQNIQGHLQTVGDGPAVAFFAQFGKNSNSPFAAAIKSSLRTSYLQQTSLAGFFAENQCTLPGSRSNQTAFLMGNWAQGGGSRAWFALTTQDQNNPYMLHARAQAELAIVVQERTTATLNQLAWGGGFLSWCGGDAAENSDELAPGTPGSTQQGPPTPDTAAGKKYRMGYTGSDGVFVSVEGPYDSLTSCSQAISEEEKIFTPDGGAELTCKDVSDEPANPGDPCTKSDGTPGTIQTPGSTIKGYLDKTLGLNSDKIAQMGNAAAQINSILNNITTVMNTVGFGASLLGADQSGGLAGAKGPNGAYTRFGTGEDAFGVGSNAVAKDALNNPSTNGQQLLDQVAEYQGFWNTLSTAAQKASTQLTSLQNACASNAAIASAAQAAQLNEVNPFLVKAQDAAKISADAQALVERLRSEGTSGGAGSGGTFLADMQAVQAAHPTASDIANIQREVQQTAEQATSSPANPLVVSGGTWIDQLNLLTANATSLQLSCQAPAAPANR